MSTRSLTHFKEKRNDGNGGIKEVTLLTMYKHYDGYPEGWGSQLANFLSEFKIVNGLSSHNNGKVANGFGCLIAQLISHFKTEPGDFYIYQPNASDCWEEYIYTVWPEMVGNDDTYDPEYEIYIRCEHSYDGEVIYEGPVSGYVVNSEEEEIDS